MGDSAAGDPAATPCARLSVAVAKYWINKRLPGFVAEAMECLGGSGYVEESGLPRLYREAPLNGIWEGSGNVICLDVLRTLARAPEALEAFLAEIAATASDCSILTAQLDRIRDRLRSEGEDPWQARALVEDLALAFQASLLRRNAPTAVADTFLAGRLGERHHLLYGNLPDGSSSDEILEMTWRD